MIQRFILSASLLGCAAVLGCAGDSPSEVASGLPPGDGVFTASPLDTIVQIAPLGGLTPPAQTIPANHIYLAAVPTSAECPPTCDLTPRRIYAPGGGTVERIETYNPDSKITVRMTSTFSYYIDHIVLDPAIAERAVVTAGQKLGTTLSNGYGLDLGVVNENHVNAGFVAPNRYPQETLDADAPLKYFVEPLRTHLYAHVLRLGSDLDGRIDYDVRGRLSGNWFLDGMATDASSSAPEQGDKQLSFAFDAYDPSQARISVGGQLAQSGVFGIAAGDPSFGSIAVGQGITTLHLTRQGGGGTLVNAGVLMVDLLAEDRVRVEMFPNATSRQDFTAAARFYRR
ncbi:MAG TPA: hypothetical protein VN706_09025 [Gemmatimonadaceae bacterium]|nr:hypothetical protein [Gemmatimonadaceae bacterium]